MAEFIRISPASSALHRSRPPWIPPNSHSLLISSTPNPTSHANAGSLHCSSTGADRMRALTVSSTDEGPLQELESAPVAVKLLPICSEAQFDQVISEAQHLHEPLIVVWMASWCRKCIYLKPKLEKLAAEYHTRLRFFCVDVNNVSHKLVARAGITKMPVIQLWRNGQKQAEVIGGHKAYLVVNEVREMIEDENDG